MKKITPYDEPPRNLYDNPLSRMTKEKNISEITQQMATLPPPNIENTVEYEKGKQEEADIERRLELLRSGSNRPSKPIVR